MDAWKQRLGSQRHSLLDDEEEDELTLRILIDNFGMENEISERRSSRSSGPWKRTNANRESEDEHKKIVKDYFGEDPVFPPKAF